MKHWRDEDGEEFRNSDACYGRAYNPSGGTIDAAKISIRGRYPEKGWVYNEEAHEMVVVIRGKGWLETPDRRVALNVGDVACLESQERYRLGGDLDLIVPCGPAFDPSKHHCEEEC